MARQFDVPATWADRLAQMTAQAVPGGNGLRHALELDIDIVKLAGFQGRGPGMAVTMRKIEKAERAQSGPGSRAKRGDDKKSKPWDKKSKDKKPGGKKKRGKRR